MAVLLLDGWMCVIAHNKQAASVDVSPTVHVSSKTLSADLINACNRRDGKEDKHTPLRNTLSSFFSALEQEPLSLDDVLERLELELLETPRLREKLDFLLFLCLCLLALRLLPMVLLERYGVEGLNVEYLS